MGIKIYLTASVLIMGGCLLAMVIVMLMAPKNELDDAKYIKAGRIAFSFYCMTGAPAAIVGGLYFITRLLG